MHKGTAGGSMDDLEMGCRNFYRIWGMDKKTAQRLFDADPAAQPFQVSFLVEQGGELLLLHRMQPLSAQSGFTPVKEAGPQMIQIQ